MRLQAASLLLVIALGAAADNETLPPASTVLGGYGYTQAVESLSRHPLQSIEGVWYYAQERLTLAIEQCPDGADTHTSAYRLVCLDTDDCSLRPGTIIGRARESVKTGKYELWLYSQYSKALTLCNPVRCIATLSADNTELTFEPTKLKMKLRLNLARFLPTLFRGISIIPAISKEATPTGLHKVFPSTEATSRIRYL